MELKIAALQCSVSPSAKEHLSSAQHGVAAANIKISPYPPLSLQIDELPDWLTKFGYLPPPDPITGQLQTQEELTKAIMVMQQFGGLEATGVLDEATFKLMKTPRCSLPDLAEAKSRKKRYTQGANKWKKRNLSWRVRTFPKDSHLGHDTVRALLYYALKVWSDITPLNFHEVAGEPKEKLEAPHLGNNLRGSSLFISDTEGMDLFAVAVHEFGHAIGLAHISATESIMRPYYQGPVGDPLKYDLPYEDKVRIWQLYGVRESVSPTAKPEISNADNHPMLPDFPENHSTVP
ncbi:MMP17: Matrix metallopeptidase 17 [Crotalus adamanteus]|uniref:MMP17: Matrix metallopeptidase 17 n=1 Tax=Crotalus adamanteus TaxID=8729 RepID=A0AAW1AQ52_CROAD